MRKLAIATVLMSCAVTAAASGQSNEADDDTDEVSEEAPAAAPNTIASKVACTGLGGSWRGHTLSYTHTQFTDGTVMTECSVSGGLLNGKASHVWSPADPGASNGLCVVEWSQTHSGAATWKFTRTGPRQSVRTVHTDSGGVYRYSLDPCISVVPAVDSDGDGTPDALDPCPWIPFVPAKYCGTGSSNWDWDGDGISNASDSCPYWNAQLTETDAHPIVIDPTHPGRPTRYMMAEFLCQSQKLHTGQRCYPDGRDFDLDGAWGLVGYNRDIYPFDPTR